MGGAWNWCLEETPFMVIAATKPVETRKIAEKGTIIYFSVLLALEIPFTALHSYL